MSEFEGKIYHVTTPLVSQLLIINYVCLYTYTKLIKTWI